MVLFNNVRPRRAGRIFAALVTAFVIATMLSPIGVGSVQADDASPDLLVSATAQGRFSVENWPSGNLAVDFGNPGDQPLIGDWNCDGTATPGVYRTVSGRAYVTNSSLGVGASTSFFFGNPGDVAIVGDFDGDGCDTVAVYRSQTSTFYVRNTLTTGAADKVVAFGNPGDQPFAGDFDGDGKDTFGVYRSTGWVFYRNGSDAAATTITYPFGNPGDYVFSEDLDGNGRDSIAAYRSSVGRVYVSRTGAAIPVAKNRVVMSAAIDATQWAEAVEKAPPAPSKNPPNVSISYDIDVELWPGDDVASIVSNAPAGTVFRINGDHSGQAIKPKDGQVFVGAPGAVLRGGGVERAFSSSAKNVVIDGLEITEYQARKQDGAIQAGGDGWVIRNNEIHNNATVGVKIFKADNAVIDSNNIHHNGQLGISVAYSDGSRVENNEIAFNNWQAEFSWGWEAGGTKFWKTDGLIVRNNWSHDNRGPGLWSDNDNINILYEGNRVEDNYANGIFHEISYGGVIRNNIVRGNGFGHDAWLWGAGILLASSQDVEVYGNEVVGNYNGITMVQQDRGSGAYGPYIVRNNTVYDNRIVNSGISGVAQDIGTSAIFNANNTFIRNDYVGSSRWEWQNRRVSWDDWRGYGLDVDGSYSG